MLKKITNVEHINFGNMLNIEIILHVEGKLPNVGKLLNPE